MWNLVHTSSSVTSGSFSTINSDGLHNGNSLKARFLYLLSFICSFLRTINDQSQELAGTRDLESGVQVESADELGIEISAQHHDELAVGEEEQLSDDIITTGNHKLKEVLVEKNSTRNANEGKDNIIFLQKIGLMVVKIWVVPIATCVATTLVQVISTNQTIISTKPYSLKLCFELLLVTIFSSAALFILSSTQWKFRGKIFIIKSMIVTAFASTMVDIILLVVFGWQFA